MRTAPSDQLKDVGVNAPTLSPWRRLARGRPGTGGVVLAIFVEAYVAVPGPSPTTGQSTFRSRASVGIAQLATVAILLSIVVAWERATRHWGSD